MKYTAIILTALLCLTGAVAPAMAASSEPIRQIPILMYHHISNDLQGTSMPELSVSPENFDAQLDYLQANGYTTLTVSQAVTMRNLPAKPIVLTFDDGYTDFYKQAWPILRAHGMTATLFIVSDDIGGLNEWDIVSNKGIPATKLLNARQIISLDRAGVEIGSHSDTHPMMTQISERQMAQEALLSQERLTRLLGHRINAFSYPYGMYNDKVCAYVANAKFKVACTTDETTWRAGNGATLRLPRFNIARDYDMKTFVKIVTGAPMR